MLWFFSLVILILTIFGYKKHLKWTCATSNNTIVALILWLKYVWRSWFFMKLQVLDLQLYSKNSFANVLLFLLLLLVLLLLLFTLFLQLSLFLLLRKCSLLFFFNKSQNNKPCVDIIRYHTTMICEHDLTKLNEKLAKLLRLFAS